jgi:hypothetical protein
MFPKGFTTMRTSLLAACLLAGSLAGWPVVAQPAAGVDGADTAPGARPGNVIGTGQSLPLSDKASNVTEGDTRSVIAPRLPTPSAGDDASPRRFLESADRAITLGRTGEAQEALERAESRLLDRSEPPSRAGAPSGQPLVTTVGDARRALVSGDRAGAQRLIAEALRGLAPR